MVDVHPLKKGQERGVFAVKLADNLVDVYIIEEKAFYHYNPESFRTLNILVYLYLSVPTSRTVRLHSTWYFLISVFIP